ncbi:hypothetical protein BH09MYX1_BH09MYX1_51250 [soil metagenome]
MKLSYPILVLLPLLACGGQTADPIDSGSDASADVVQDVSIDMKPIFECPATSPGAQIYGLCLTTIEIIDEGGGFAPAPPAGSDCKNGQARHLVVLKTHATHDEVCFFGGPNQPYKLVKSDGVLSDTAWAALVAALEDARVASAKPCGTDKSILKLTVTSNALEPTTYTDSFYSCQGNGLYADGLDEIMAVFMNPK